MDFLSRFTLYDVFLVAIGLVLASLIRIYYDSYKEKVRLKRLDRMIKVYNDSMDIYEEGVLVLSNKDDVIFANKEALRIFAAKHTELTAEYLRKKVNIRLKNSLDTDDFFNIIHTRRNIPHVDILTGNTFTPVSMNTNIFPIEFGQNEAWQIVILQDIAYKLNLQERIESVSSYKDLLTNLPTRYHLSADLVAVILEATHKESNTAIGMFGIRDFHALRTLNGIEKIDFLLRNIAGNVSDALDKNATLYRFDCDAFAIVFKNIIEKNDIRREMESVMLKVENLLLREGIKAEIMRGLYFKSKEDITVEKMLNESYRILRSRYNEKISTEYEGFSKIEQKIDSMKYLASKLTKEDFLDGIANKDFFFFYQPIYRLSDDKVIGIEVLTRFNHRKYGFLFASNFMSKAVEFDVMPEITAHLLDNVLGQKKFWSVERGLELDMTINLALSDLRSGVFAEMLDKKLQAFHIDPKSIIIDIPEKVLAEDFDSVAEEFYMLSKMGVRLCIDHFGEGAINLKHLDMLPLEAIKIDESIIENMTDDEQKRRLVSSIVSVCDELHIKVGANHVDSVGTKETLRELGCHFAQGYHYGKAVPAFEITEVIKQV